MTAERAALAELTVYFQPPLVAQQNMFDDSETQASSPTSSRATGIHSIEALSQSGYVVWRNATA